MQQERRKHHTPFIVTGSIVRDPQGTPIAIFVSDDLAQFAALACNLHDDLIQIHHLCAGHVANQTIQPGNQTLKALNDLFQKIAADISKRGR